MPGIAAGRLAGGFFAALRRFAGRDRTGLPAGIAIPGIDPMSCV
jgi:hypothetical protein